LGGMGITGMLLARAAGDWGITLLATIGPAQCHMVHSILVEITSCCRVHVGNVLAYIRYLRCTTSRISEIGGNKRIGNCLNDFVGNRVEIIESALRAVPPQHRVRNSGTILEIADVPGRGMVPCGTIASHRPRSKEEHDEVSVSVSWASESAHRNACGQRSYISMDIGGGGGIICIVDWQGVGVGGDHRGRQGDSRRIAIIRGGILIV